MSSSEALAAPLGLFGGTFDPVHHGHLQLAEVALRGLALDGVRWLPSGQPGHRATPCATPAQRVAMVALAIAGQPRFTLDTRELASDRPTYTVPMLESLRAELGAQRPLVLILGSDAFAGLTQWHRWHELLSLAHVAVAERAEHPLRPTDWPAALAREFAGRRGPAAALKTAPGGGIAVFAMPPRAVSSTAVRAGLAAGAPLDALLPEAVLDYIRSHHLYQAPHERF